MFLNEGGQAPDRVKDFLDLLVAGLDLDAVLPAQGHRELQRVDRIETEPLHEERGIRVDLFCCHVFEHEGLDDEVLYFDLQLLHDRTRPSGNATPRRLNADIDSLSDQFAALFNQGEPHVNV